MVTSAASVEWTVVGTEVEALQLEYNWIKEFDPRFNVRYRDDKSYPELAVTLQRGVPAVPGDARAAPQGGPLLRPVRPRLGDPGDARPAATGLPGPHLLGRRVQARPADRPALPARLHRQVLGPVRRPGQRRGAPRHRRGLLRLPGRPGRADGEADGARDARRLRRPRLRAGGPAARRPVGAAAGAGEAVRGAGQRHRRRPDRHRRRRPRGVGADLPRPRRPDARPARLDRRRRRRQHYATPTGSAQRGLSVQVENFLVQYYGNRATESAAEARPAAPGSPRGRPAAATSTPPTCHRCRGRSWCRRCRRTPTRWPTGCPGCADRGCRCGSRSAATRSDLAETAARNAKDALARHRLKRASDLTSRSAALTELADALGMDNAPLRIECIDISHVQGTNVVASLVVFEDGLAKRSDYRRFAIRDAPGDDVASIAEVVRRRFARAGRRSEQAAAASTGRRCRPGIDPETGRVRRFAYPPQLLVVDGGQPQVNAAAAAMAELGDRRRHRRRAGQAAGGGLAARRRRAGHPAAHQRGALPAAAAPRRGAPLRHHLPPREALEGDDGVRAGRRPRPRARPGGPRCSSTSGRSRSCGPPSVTELTAVPGIGAGTAASIVAALAGEPGPGTAARPARRRSGGSGRFRSRPSRPATHVERTSSVGSSRHHPRCPGCHRPS